MNIKFLPRTMIVSPSEREDFESAIDRAGYDKHDLEISEENAFPAQGIGVITGTVTIRNKRTGVERMYKAGHATAWVVEFETDLQTGLFTR